MSILPDNCRKNKYAELRQRNIFHFGTNCIRVFSKNSFYFWTICPEVASTKAFRMNGSHHRKMMFKGDWGCFPNKQFAKIDPEGKSRK